MVCCNYSLKFECNYWNGKLYVFVSRPSAQARSSIIKHDKTAAILIHSQDSLHVSADFLLGGGNNELISMQSMVASGTNSKHTLKCWTLTCLFSPSANTNENNPCSFNFCLDASKSWLHLVAQNLIVLSVTNGFLMLPPWVGKLHHWSSWSFRMDLSFQL